MSRDNTNINKLSSKCRYAFWLKKQTRQFILDQLKLLWSCLNIDLTMTMLLATHSQVHLEGLPYKWVEAMIITSNKQHRHDLASLYSIISWNCLNWEQSVTYRTCYNRFKQSCYNSKTGNMKKVRTKNACGCCFVVEMKLFQCPTSPHKVVTDSVIVWVRLNLPVAIIIYLS